MQQLSGMRNVQGRRATQVALRQPRGCAVTARVISGERSSLVPQTLLEMSQDVELQQREALLAAKGQAALSREERRQRQRSLDGMNLPAFTQLMQANHCPPLVRSPCRVFQVNIGLYCNQACSHCHVESSPKRSEAMDRGTAERCVELMRGAGGSVDTLDITGGAPEFNPHFRYLVTEAVKLGLQVIDRCNLTVLLEPGQEDLAAFLAAQRVRVVASLPCYSQENVDKQRGVGVFERSIKALQLLNSLGYGKAGTGLILDLVYNPGGAFLAPPQAQLQPAYSQELESCYGIQFNSLLCLNNMPIKRFTDWLIQRDQLGQYMKLLVDNFNPAAAEGIMCRDTVSVRWDGTLYDCDFNQQLDLPTIPSRAYGTGGRSDAPASPKPRSRLTVFDVSSLDELTGWKIACGNHCYGCTAGAGSSCQGATSSEDS